MMHRRARSGVAEGVGEFLAGSVEVNEDVIRDGQQIASGAAAQIGMWVVVRNQVVRGPGDPHPAPLERTQPNADRCRPQPVQQPGSVQVRFTRPVQV